MGSRSDSSLAIQVPSAAATRESAMDIATTMQASLDLVFGERDLARRTPAIRKIYDENAEFHEAQSSPRGHEAISQAVEDVLGNMAELLEEIEVADGVGLDVVGIGGQHRAEFLDSARDHPCRCGGPYQHHPLGE